MAEPTKLDTKSQVASTFTNEASEIVPKGSDQRPEQPTDLGMDQWAILKPGQYDLEKLSEERDALEQKTKAALDELMLANAGADDAFLSYDAIATLSNPSAFNQSPELKTLITDKLTEIVQDKEAFEAKIMELLENGQPEKAVDLMVLVTNQTDIDIQDIAQKAHDYMLNQSGLRYTSEAWLLDSLVSYDLSSPAAKLDQDLNAKTLEVAQPKQAETAELHV